MRMILVYLCAFAIACGGKGEGSGGGQEKPATPPAPGLLPPVDSWVEGRMLEGQSLWLMDHLTCHVRAIPIDDSGYFAIQIDHFEPKHVYSFEVVDNNLVHLGSVDFSEKTGLQSSVIFYGGLGFNMGMLQKASQPSSEGNYVAKLDGGFRLSSANLFLNASRPCVSSLRYAASPTLSVFHSHDLFYGFFYRNRSLPRYVAALDRYAGLVLSLKSSFKQPLESVRLHKGAPNIHLAETADGLSWRDTDFRWTIINGHHAKQVLSLPSRYRPGDSFLTEVTIADGQVFTIATKIEHYLSQPPQLVARCQIGECTNISYASVEEENGLTRPLVVSPDHDLRLDILRPLRHDRTTLVFPEGSKLQIRLHTANAFDQREFKANFEVKPDSQVDKITIGIADLKKIADAVKFKNPIKLEYVYMVPEGIEIAGSIMSIDLTQSNTWSVNSN